MNKTAEIYEKNMNDSRSAAGYNKRRRRTAFPAGRKEGTSMEIERKFLITALPEHLDTYPCRMIEQGYLSTDPVVRVRRDSDRYYLTYKGKGLLAREEYDLPLTEEAYRHLLRKADGRIITKRRYLLPCGPYTIELDVFLGDLAPLVIAEVEFPDLEAAGRFLPPDWFGKEVTMDPAYHNSVLSSA